MNSYDYYKKEGFIVIASEIVFKYLSKFFQSRKISDIADTTSGGTPNRNRKDYFAGNIPWIKSGELNNGLITCCEEYISEEGLKNSSAKLYPKGTLVLALYGATVGKVGILDFESSSNQAVCAIFENKDMVLKEYLFWFFRQKRKDYIEQSFGGAQPNISQKVVRDTLIPLPDMEIQMKIVDFLNKLYHENFIEENFIYPQIVKTIKKTSNVWHRMEYILENINKQINYIKHFRQNILQEAVQGKLVPQDPNDEPASVLLERIKEEKERLIKEGKIKKEKPLPPISEDEIPYELPKGWEWVRLGEIAIINPRNDIDDDVEVSFIPMKLIEDGYSNKHSSEAKKWRDVKSGFTHFQEGDVVIAKITPCFQNRKSAIMKNLINGYGAGTTELYVVRNYANTVLPEYLLALFKTEAFIKGGVATYTGTAGQQRVKKDYIENLPFPLSPLNEQKRIVQKVDQLMALCDELEKNIEQSKKESELLMQSVLQEAFKEA